MSHDANSAALELDPDYTVWPPDAPPPADRPFDFDILIDGKPHRGFVSEAERDAAGVMAAMLDAADHADQFLDWVERFRQRPEAEEESWAEYAGEEIAEVPWLLRLVAGTIELSGAMEQMVHRRLAALGPAFDPSAADAEPQDRALAGILVHLARVGNLLNDFIEKYGVAESDTPDAVTSRPHWAALLAADLRGAAWGLARAGGVLPGELLDEDWRSAWERMEARHAQAGRSIAASDASEFTPERFEQYLARKLDRDQEFRRWFERKTQDQQAEYLTRLRRSHLRQSSRVYADAHRIYRMADRLAGLMKRFARQYTGEEGTEIIRAAGLPDSEDYPAQYWFAAVRADIAVFGPVVDHFAGLMNEVTAPPIRRAAA